MDISERIKFYRKEQGLTQKDLGIRINKSAQVVSNWERGYTTSINQDDILKLSNAFGVAIEKLVDKDTPLFESSPKISADGLPTLTPKDERQIAHDLENMLDSLNGAAAMSDDPEDEEDREMLKAALLHAMTLSKRMAKKKFTPKKYRRED